MTLYSHHRQPRDGGGGDFCFGESGTPGRLPPVASGISCKSLAGLVFRGGCWVVRLFTAEGYRLFWDVLADELKVFNRYPDGTRLFGVMTSRLRELKITTEGCLNPSTCGR